MLDRAFRGLVRRTWIITLATVCICAVFGAHAAASLVAAAALTDAPEAPAVHHLAPPAARPDPTAATERLRVAGDAMVVRNPFCSSCTAPVGGAPGEPEIASLPAVLIAINQGAASYATIRVLDSDVQGSWAVGETIRGLGRLDRINAASVELVDTAGRRGHLSLRAPAEPAAGGGQVTAMAEPPLVANPWASRVTKLDETNYTVERSIVRELVSGAGKDSARAVPILENGEIKGLRLYGVSPTSIAYAIGLHTGDRLTAIDGEPIKNAQQMLDLYAKLDQLAAVEISGTRSGKPIVRTLRLR